ncbi:hypothetical protein BH11PSE7_BH11PSE7_18720 [soil metagenome]
MVFPDVLTDSPARSRSRWGGMEPSVMAVAAGVFLSLIVVAGTAWRMWEEYADGLARETARAELLASVLDEQATQSFETTGVVMASLAELAGDASRPAVAPEMQTGMTQALVSLPFLRSIALVSSQGQVLAATSGPDTGTTLDLAALSPATPSRKGAIGPWVPARELSDVGAPGPRVVPPGLGLIPFIYRFTAASGRELALVAAINPDALLGFQQLSLEGDGRVAILASHSGRVLVSAHDASSSGLAPGTAISAHGIFARELAARNHGVFVAPGVEPGMHVIAYVASRSQPLVVLVERPVAQLVAHWWRLVIPLLGVAALALAAFAAMTLLAWKSLRVREGSQRQLQAQFELTALVLEISPMPVSMTDRHGRYLAVNRAWEEFMWLDRGDVIGKPKTLSVQDDAARLDARQDRDLLAEGGNLRHELRVLHPDGSARDVMASKVAVPGVDGGFDAILCALMDITEFRDAERATREARDAAEASSRSKSEFVANISHELRTPLQAIIGFSELGMSGGASGERAATMFGYVNESGERMLALVNDLLDVAKIESSIGSVHLVRADVRRLVRDAVAELTPLLQARQLRVQMDMPDSDMEAKFDDLRLQQVMRNVLANAIKFSPPESVITVRGNVFGDELRISVRDRGPGIPEAELDQIFEAFVQSSRTKDGSGGTGLGLAICRKIMRAHGGSIIAGNATGGGARITIALPVPGHAGAAALFQATQS